MSEPGSQPLERGFRDELPAGSIVVERYTYTSPQGKKGVQWLSSVVSADGSLTLYGAFKTRSEALAEANRRG